MIVSRLWFELPRQLTAETRQTIKGGTGVYLYQICYAHIEKLLLERLCLSLGRWCQLLSPLGQLKQREQNIRPPPLASSLLDFLAFENLFDCHLISRGNFQNPLEKSPYFRIALIPKTTSYLRSKLGDNFQIPVGKIPTQIARQPIARLLVFRLERFVELLGYVFNPHRFLLC